MKKFSLVLSMVLFTIGFAMAQRTVVGQITDQDGEALIGATILAQGTDSGTVTDIDGKFSVNVPSGANALEVSYTGYDTQIIELGASNVVNVVLAAGVTLKDVVVTALGIERDKKSLGYAAQQVEGEELTRVKDANFINSLSGKVAGVDIKRSSNLGGSSNVIIRGYTSLGNNNQALFVVDGVPINNDISNTRDQQSGRGGYDYGNAAMDINPEDVENVSVLRGAAATALYGSRGGNGVILITTKKGTKGKKGIGVTFNTGITSGSIDKSTMVRYQDEYGPGYSSFRGWYGSPDGNAMNLFDFGNGEGLAAPVEEDASFGDRYDPNLQVFSSNSYFPELDDYGKKFPFVAGANDATTFFETALTYNNSVSIDGGTDAGSFRLSYTNFDQAGILPNSKIKKNSVNFSSSYDLTEKLTANASVNFINTQGKGRYGTGYDSRNVMQSFRQWYSTMTDVQNQREVYDATGNNISWNPYGAGNPPISTQPHYFDNYYWTMFENFSTDERNRMIGNVSLSYKLTDWLDVMGRVAMDRYDEIQEGRIAVGSVDVPEYERFNKASRELNSDLFLNFNKYLGTGNEINLNGMVGLNVNQRSRDQIRSVTNGGLVVPGVYALSNSVNGIEAPTEYAFTRKTNGYFGRASVGYDNFLYLDLTGRYDISSTLPEGNNAYFYPSASLSFVFSELINSSALSFGKFRINYSEVANDAPPFSIADGFILNTPFQGTALASAPNTKNNPSLRPERTNSYEAGLELNFLRNRFGIDATYYSASSYDQILRTARTGATGQLFQFVNAGQIDNSGIELAVNLTPVKTKDFDWTMRVNWTRNRNEVIELAEGATNFQISTAQGGISFNATVGQPYGTIWGSNYVFYNDDPDKPIVIDADAGAGKRFQRSAAPEVIGDINPDWRGGVWNGLTYKDVSFSFLIDVQKGGDYFSLDRWYGTATGIYEHTAGLNDKGNEVRSSVDDGGGLPIGGYNEDGSANEVYGYAQDVFTSFGYARGVNAMHVYDASFVKLREVALTYALPNSLFASSILNGASVSLTGRNLYIFSKDDEYGDPEAGVSAGTYQLGNQSGAYPAVKEVGVNLRLQF